MQIKNVEKKDLSTKADSPEFSLAVILTELDITTDGKPFKTTRILSEKYVVKVPNV